MQLCKCVNACVSKMQLHPSIWLNDEMTISPGQLSVLWGFKHAKPPDPSWTIRHHPPIVNVNAWNGRKYGVINEKYIPKKIILCWISIWKEGFRFYGFVFFNFSCSTSLQRLSINLSFLCLRFSSSMDGSFCPHHKREGPLIVRPRALWVTQRAQRGEGVPQGSRLEGWSLDLMLSPALVRGGRTSRPHTPRFCSVWRRVWLS